jgi:hypothetical protein
VAPEDSELPLLRYMFVHHVRNFPFLDRAKEKEFWQDKLQMVCAFSSCHTPTNTCIQFLESFATKRISSSEDRLEETKRRKLAVKAQKLVELMMVSGLPTASGYEERIRFSEMEVVDRGANDQGLAMNVPEGHQINGWDVNVASVRTTSVKRHVRHHAHAEYLLRVKQPGKPEIYVGRRYSEFAEMHKRLRLEIPGKVLPPLPRKNHSNSLYSRDDDDADSVSSASTQGVKETVSSFDEPVPANTGGSLRSYLPNPFSSGHRRTPSKSSQTASPRASLDASSTSRFGRKSGDHSRDRSPPKVLYREEQRVSLRAFLRNFLQNESIAHSNAMNSFLTGNVVTLNEEEREDVRRRIEMDEKRIEEQRRFYEIARQRARELDVHMEKFRREVVESSKCFFLFFLREYIH